MGGLTDDIQADEIDRMLDQMAGAVRDLISTDGAHNAAMIGIRTGGVWIAQQLHARVGMEEPLGELDINFYRDDFTRIGLQPQVSPSSLPFSVDDRRIVLVDDVLHTGRTVRAALNEIFDYGRPASVHLAVLVERGSRELPVRADIAGCQMPLAAGEHVKLTGPEPLSLVIQRTA